MDQIAFVILIVSGLCIPSDSVPYVFHFVNKNKTWHGASNYCREKYLDLAQIDSTENTVAMKNTPTDGYTDKAWIGLYEGTYTWYWTGYSASSTIKTVYLWKEGEPDNKNADEFCVTLNGTDGRWSDANCLDKKPFVCYTGGGMFSYKSMVKTWGYARYYCDDHGLYLARSRDSKENSNISSVVPNGVEAWIGLYRIKGWYWKGDGRSDYIRNWQTGQPDNKAGMETCVTMRVEQGDWSDEKCGLEYPFFCYEYYKRYTTVVRIKIQSDANMEDPTSHAQLLQQFNTVFANQGITTTKLSLKIQAVKEKQ